MATDPFVLRKNYTTLNELGVRVNLIKQVLNLGAAARNQNSSNVPARYQLYPLRSWATTFVTLPAPSDAGIGARVIITDVTDDEFAVGWGGTVTVGGGLNKSPAWSDGTNWIIG